MKSLLQQENYSQEWVKDFYTQAGIWWGTDPQAAGTHEYRVKTIERLCGPGMKRILDLGAGPGHTVAALADCGHTVVGVELNPTDAAYARELLKTTRKGVVTFLEADFYTIELDGLFDVVTCWQVFGMGSDADQRRLLRRIAQEWLAPTGSVLLDVYNPMGPARDNGREWRLAPLPGVTGSVEMIERCHYDPVQGRWVDGWQPTANPEHTLAQTLRCYTPADLLLLLEGTGLCLKTVEIGGEAVDVTANKRTTSTDLFKSDYNYLVQLSREAATTAP
jgi:SAM-dependent methyltransferase